jgi:hypothetical protein
LPFLVSGCKHFIDFKIKKCLQNHLVTKHRISSTNAKKSSSEIFDFAIKKFEKVYNKKINQKFVVLDDSEIKIFFEKLKIDEQEIIDSQATQVLDNNLNPEKEKIDNQEEQVTINLNNENSVNKVDLNSENLIEKEKINNQEEQVINNLNNENSVNKDNLNSENLIEKEKINNQEEDMVNNLNNEKSNKNKKKKTENEKNKKKKRKIVIQNYCACGKRSRKGCNWCINCCKLNIIKCNVHKNIIEKKNFEKLQIDKFQIFLDDFEYNLKEN